MNYWLSKVQFEHFEDGEYHDEHLRNEQEFLTLLHHFTFSHSSKDSLIYTVSNAIVLENRGHVYYKFMSFKPGEYIIWYYPVNEKVVYSYTLKGGSSLDKLIHNIYNNQNIESLLGEPESIYTESSIRESFKSRSFIFKPSQRLNSFLWNSLNSILLFLIGFIFILLVPNKLIALFIGLVLIIIVIPTILLFINYWIKTAGYLLIISKGRDTFQFGHRKNIFTFNKNDIVGFEEYCFNHIKNLYYHFYYVKIKFRDGGWIIIPNSMIDEFELMLIFPKLTRYSRLRNPFIKGPLMSRNY